MDKNVTFVLVDDDAINNMLSEILIEDLYPTAKIISFTDPDDGIDYFTTYYSDENKETTFLFLDINMPLMTGWEFLEILDKKGIKKNDSLYIYMLSSSVNHIDLKKSEQNPNIVNFVEKPLSNEFLNEISEKF
jgi:CheY-like chemotaxis protein